MKGDCMKYTTEEALKEIQRRGNRIRRRHDRKVMYALTVSTITSFIALLIVISAFSATAVSDEQSVYGSFILPKEAGGFVLSAVIGFALGVSITFAIRHYQEIRSKRASSGDK